MHSSKIKLRTAFLTLVIGTGLSLPAHSSLSQSTVIKGVNQAVTQGLEQGSTTVGAGEKTATVVARLGRRDRKKARRTRYHDRRKARAASSHARRKARHQLRLDRRRARR